MSPEVLSLLERKAASLHDEHVRALHAISNALLHSVDLARKGTVANALPQFQAQVESALAQHLQSLTSEVVSIIERTGSKLAVADVTVVVSACSKQLEDSLYIERLRLFLDSISRHYGRAGTTIDLSPFRPDLVEALLHVGASNRIRAFKSSLADELEIIARHQESQLALNRPETESKLELANQIIKVEPNVFGIGLNLNNAFKRWLRRRG